MSEITLHIHPETARSLLSDGQAGARAVASISRQALRIVQGCGWHIAYAPVILPNGAGCAMSAYGGARGLVIDIDRPGTLVAGRGVVREAKIASQSNKATTSSPVHRR